MMNTRRQPQPARPIRCAIYTRKSTEKGLEQDFNSLDAQREACEAYIASQKHEGWVALAKRYDDGGFSGGNLERPALARLLKDIEAGRVDMVVCYKIDRLSRSLLDFTKLVDAFDQHDVSFVSITQQFSSATAMGRLTLNILLSFAEFERAIIAERVRDKIAGAKRKGKFCGGTPLFGYDVERDTHRLIINEQEAKLVRHIFKRFTEMASGLTISKELNERGLTTKSWTTKAGVHRAGRPWNAPCIYRMLNNRTYLGETVHGDKTYPGEHEAIIPKPLCDKVQSVLAIHRPNGRIVREKAPMPLRGIIYCGHCRRAMTTHYTQQKGRIYRYYVCTKAIKNGYSACRVRSVGAAQIEEAVIDQLRAVFRSPEIVAQTYLAAQEMQSQDLDHLTAEKAELEVAISALRQRAAGLDADLDRAVLDNLTSHLVESTARLAQVEAELAQHQGPGITEKEVADSLRNIDSVWSQLFPIEQKRIIHALVERVTVKADGLDVSIRSDGLHSIISELKGDTSSCQQ